MVTTPSTASPATTRCPASAATTPSSAESGNDSITGGLGNDLLTGGSGTDNVNGGEGDDVFFIRTNAAQTDTMTGGAGTDTIRLDLTTSDIVLAGTSRITGVETWEGSGRSIVGTAGADVFDFRPFTAMNGVASIQGLGGNDTMTGNAGANVILGGDGNDRLDGGGGNDTLTGNAGTDAFVVTAATSSGLVTVTDFDANGNDTLRLLGFGFGGATTDAQRLSAIQAATTFAGGTATIDLDALGGNGDLRLNGVTALSFTGTEDFVFS